MNETDMRPAIEMFKAVGQQERLKILGLLANRAHTVTELAQVLDIKQTEVVRHLHKLRETGLITEVYTPAYQLSNHALEHLGDIAAGKTDRVAMSVNERILDKYLEGNRLQRIPPNPDERIVILRWLADQFTVGKKYTRAEVNEIIQRHYQKQELLRRFLVDSRLLKRVGDVFWRPQE
jgi:biotin operon repressor